MKISFMIGHISHAAQSYNNMYNYERVCVCVWKQLIYALLGKFDCLAQFLMCHHSHYASPFSL